MLMGTTIAFSRSARAEGSCALWIAAGALWSKRRLPNLWGPEPTAALPLANAATAAVIASRALVLLSWPASRHSRSRMHPRSRVLSFERDQFAARFIDPSPVATTMGEEWTDTPYASYMTKVPYYYRARQGPLVGAARVYGIVLRGRAKAYPLLELRPRGVIRDVVAGVPVVIRYDDEAFSAAAFADGVRLPGTFAFWFAWRSIYPSTAVYSPPTDAPAP